MYLLEIYLPTHREYVPFTTLWAATLKAQDWVRCKNVECIALIQKSTDETLEIWEG